MRYKELMESSFENLENGLATASHAMAGFRAPEITIHGPLNKFKYASQLVSDFEMSLLDINKLLTNYGKVCKYNGISPAHGSEFLDKVLTDLIDVTKGLKRIVFRESGSDSTDIYMTVVKNAKKAIDNYSNLLENLSSIDISKFGQPYNRVVESFREAIPKLIEAMRHMIGEIESNLL